LTESFHVFPSGERGWPAGPLHQDLLNGANALGHHLLGQYLLWKLTRSIKVRNQRRNLICLGDGLLQLGDVENVMDRCRRWKLELVSDRTDFADDFIWTEELEG